MPKHKRTKTLDLTWFGEDLAAAVDAGEEPGLWALGNLVLNEAQRRAPKLTGRLERSGYVATTTRSSYARQSRDRARLPRPKAQQVLVAFAAFYAKIIEGGSTEAHAIPGKSRRSVHGTAKVLKIPGIGYRTAVMHPGSKRRAFLGPALESVKQQGTEVLADEIRKTIERELPEGGLMIAEIESVIWDTLRNHSTLTAATGVYLHEIPEEELRPCVVIEATLRPEGEGGTAPVYTAEIRTAVYAKTHAANETLSGAVWVALYGLMYGAPGLRLGPLTLVQVEPGYEVIWDQYRLTMVWSAFAVMWIAA